MGKLSSFFSTKFGTKSGSLTFKDKITLALPGPASVIGPIIIHNTLMKFYTDIIGLDAKFYGWIYLLYSIWNAINDPLLGAYIDKMPFSKKRGKYVYLMRVTAPTMLISIFFMLLSSPSWSDWLVFWVLLAELFIFDTAYTVYSVAYNSYFLLAAPDKEERVDVDIIRTYIGNVLGAITTIIPTLLLVGGGNRALVIPVFSVVILVNAAMYFIALKNLKDKASLYETATPPEHHSVGEIWTDVRRIIFSKPFLTYLLFYIIARGAIGFYFTPFLYFMDSVVKSTNTVATLADVIPGIIMLILLPWAGSKIKTYGSKTITLLAFIPAILGFSSLLFITKGWQAVISYTLIVFALNVIQTAGVVLNGELIDYDEMLTGTRKTGLYGGLFALLTTSLTGLQATIFSNILSHYGYDGKLAMQTERAVWGIRVGAGLIPIIMCVIGFIPMLFFPIGRKLEREISDFNVAARQGNRKKIKVSGTKLYTASGEEFIAKGINMVCKDATRNYIGDYTADDFRFLKEHGFNLIRLGLIWDGAEPSPGVFNEEYFEKIDGIIGLAASEDIPVFLDLHQDLYGVTFEDGAPAWATITDGAEHVRTELWSESYLVSPAVQRSFDNFWRNAPAPDGVGIRTHYIGLLKYIAKRYADNPYVVGIDVMNEPFPGTPGAQVGEIMGRFLQGGDASAFNDPSTVEAIVGEILPITSQFETEVLWPFYCEAARVIRSVSRDLLFMFEANYFANAGIPSALKPATYENGDVIENQVFVPHGYDILVDTDSYSEGGLERVGFIFGSILKTASEMGIPAIIGEWGCYPDASEAQKKQAAYLISLFKENGVGNVYYDYSHLSDGKIIEVL